MFIAPIQVHVGRSCEHLWVARVSITLHFAAASFSGSVRLTSSDAQTIYLVLSSASVELTSILVPS